MTRTPQDRLRSLFAILCLIAVFLLYAPLAGAAWFVYSGACCNAGECPIHGHHPSQPPSAPQHAMECGHEMPSTAQCSMSCCQHPDRPALAPVIFVLPGSLTASTGKNFETLVPVPESRKTVASIEPLSPPPRILAPAA